MTLDSTMADAARQMDDAGTTTDVLAVAVEWALALVPGCDMAGVTLRRRRGRLESVVQSDPIVAQCDALQHELGEGPCVQAIVDQPVIASDDAAADERWPRWGPRVGSEHGVRSMLSVRLFTSDRVHGALNLYGRDVASFSYESVDLAVLLSTHASVALRSALADENLRLAVDSRHRIGQAQGILMERFSLDASRSFDLLRRVSQQQNIRLIDLADHVVERRQLPEPPSSSHDGTGRDQHSTPAAR